MLQRALNMWSASERGYLTRPALPPVINAL
jgi:hypothetical protein